MPYTRDSHHELYASFCVTYVVFLLNEQVAVHTVMNFRLAKCTQWMEAAVSFRTVINTYETVLRPEDRRYNC